MATQIFRFVDGGGMQRIDLNARSISHLFENLDFYISKLKDMGYDSNLFYTVHDSDMDAQRKFNQCTHIMFDIDHCDVSKWNEYLETVMQHCGGDRGNWSVVNSGHGLHLLAELTDERKWNDDSKFALTRLQYNGLCGKLGQLLTTKGLTGKVDSGIWDRTRVFRLPGTINKKKDKEPVQSALLHIGTKQLDFNLGEVSGIEEHKNTRGISEDFTKERTGEISPSEYNGANDEDAILTCAAIKQASTDPASIDEPLWYAIDSIVGRFKEDRGHKLIHQWSKSHPSYNQEAVNKKITQALEKSGPRTCKHIEGLWQGCTTCPHYGKVKSPIQIKGPDFITTGETGFHDLIVQPNGTVKRIPNFEDMKRAFKKEYKGHFIAHASSRSAFTWTGDHYQPITDVEVESFAFRRFAPRASKLAEEFRKQIYISEEIRTVDWFKKSTESKLNLINGVYDLMAGRLVPHSPEYGFKATLGFAFDPVATCPEFDTFMTNITQGDRALEKMILDYIAYALAGERCTAEKILIMTGEGSNGKTTLLRILRAIFASSMVSFRPQDFSDKFALVRLDGALACVLEETPSYRDRDFWEMMKNLSSGGQLQVSEKFKPSYEFENRAKIFMTCNVMPGGTDASHGFYRRMLIAPFNATFEGEGKDERIGDRIIANELPGVLNRLIRVYKELKKGEFKLTVAGTSEKALAEYTLEHDHVLAWIQETIRPAKPEDLEGLGTWPGRPTWLQIDKDGTPLIYSHEAFSLYQEWCKARNVAAPQVGNASWFSKRIKQAFRSFPTVIFTLRKINGNAVRCIAGIVPISYEL